MGSPVRRVTAAVINTLIRKAARDAGFDLVLGADGDWMRVGVSGTRGAVWVRAAAAGPLLAVPPGRVASDVRGASQDTTTQDTVDLPAGAAAAATYPTAGDLYAALCRVRVLMAETPARLSERVRARLAAISGTEVTAEITKRVGQDVFREALDEYWDARCAVTGLALRPLLRGSHTKPWTNATDDERLDVHNGFLLTVHLDALFDKGLITFDDDGLARFSGHVAAADLSVLGLPNNGLRLRWVAEGHLPFLEYHRSQVFRP
jgi:putative restriction endonuclease